MGTIRVTGKGKASVRPDRIQLFLTISELCKKYEDTVALSSKMTAAMKSALEQAGFEATALKTMDFAIDSEEKGYQNKQGIWTSKPVGYRFRHELKLEMDADNVLLGKALTAITDSGVLASFRIRYTVKDPDECRNQVLKAAVSDSKGKAELLAEQAGMRLGSIVTIDYSWGDAELYTEPMGRSMKCMSVDCAGEEAANGGFSMEADDIRVTDTVTIVWNLDDAR